MYYRIIDYFFLLIRRERAGLIHFFEKIDEHPTEGEVNTARVPRTGRGRAQNRSQRFNKDAIKADRRKAVKAYTRPAAGVNKTIASDLRPTPVLKKTVAYLCTRLFPGTFAPRFPLLNKYLVLYANNKI